MVRVGLTGGIAAGKSAVVSRLAQRGAVIIDSDQLAREVVSQGSQGLAALVEEFGDDILNHDGQLDRAVLGQLVFSDPAVRSRVEAITHPRIRALSAQREEQAIRADPLAVIVHDIPLLVELGMADRFEHVVVVEAPEALRLRRMVDLRGMTDADARARISAQASDQERRAVATTVIRNAGSLHELDTAVDRLWLTLSQ